MKNKYAWLLLVGASGLGPVARAQQVLLHSEVARDTLAPRTGPNRRYFGHFYLSYGLVAGSSSAGLPLRYGLGCLLLRGPHGRPDTLRYTRTPQGLRLTGTLGGDSVRWLARPLAWQKLPLLQAGHWAL